MSHVTPSPSAGLRESDGADLVGEDLSGSTLYDRAGRRFRLVRRLGQGGFGTVYRALVRSPGGLELDVALKLIHAEATLQPQPVERLLDEATLLARLRHPVIVTAHDLAWFGKRPALIIEYVEGADLLELLQDQQHPLPLSGLLHVTGQVASALDAAFATCGIVHRDVKPANIRIARHGNVKLLDFGIARSAEVTRGTETTGGVLGSLYYLAPERFDPEQRAQPASDVFSLGCVLFEGVTGEGLLRGLELPQLLALARDGQRLDAWVAKRLAVPMPPDVRALLGEMLAADPILRPNAAQVAARCERLCAMLPEAVTLRAWCREHAWPQESSPETDLTDLVERPAPTLPETVIRHKPSELPETVIRHKPSHAPVSLQPVLSQPAPLQSPAPAMELTASEPRAEPTAARQAPPAYRRPGLASSGPWLGLGLAALLPLGLLFLGLVSGLTWWLLPREEATPRPAPPLVLPEPDVVVLPEPPPPERPAPAPAPAPPVEAEPALVRVTFTGQVGASVWLDGQRQGETNLSYDVPVGAHICGVGHGVPEQTLPCELTPETRTVRLPDLAPPGSVSSATPIQLLRSDGVRFEPGLLPSGDYEIHADLGDGMRARGQVKVRPNFHAWVTCDASSGGCIAR